MGLTIAYTIRLSSRSAVPGFIAAARAEAKRLDWKTRRAAAGAPTVEFVPHAKCEPVRLDFTSSLRCEEIVKTSGAPLKTHVQVVEFLRAIQPLAKSLRVDDECEFWETEDKALLKKHRDAFSRATGNRTPRKNEPPVKFTFGAVVVRSGGS